MAQPPRHSIPVRISHWLVTFAFFALLVTGVEIVISHPRFYWGESGNVNTPALFQLPIPASRGAVKTGYTYVLPDQNGWSRALHFQAAWVLGLTGFYYLISGLRRKHFSSRLTSGEDGVYNRLQRQTYLVVIFVVFPLQIATGLGMAPMVTSVMPIFATAFGGQQSARTIHFFLTVVLVAFVLGHVVMVIRNGFWKQVRAMTIGQNQSLEAPE